MGIFKKRQYGVVTMPLDESNVPVVPDGTWVKCDKCGKILYKKYTLKIQITKEIKIYL